jgi:hypothetical protein
MDVVVNSNIQSPLIRTLGRTKGKGESFTNQLKDNVPPVSFSKIELNPEGGATGGFDRNYKIKVPQYGYLRNFVIKFTSHDLPIPPQVLEHLYSEISQSNIKAKALYSNIRGTIRGALPGAEIDLVSTASNPASHATAPDSQKFMLHGYVPYEEAYNVAEPSSDPWAQIWLRIHGGVTLDSEAATYTPPPLPNVVQGATVAAAGGARMCPFRYSVRDNIIDSEVMDASQNRVDGISREGPFYDQTEYFNVGTDGIPVQNSNNGNMRRWLNGSRVFNTWDWCTQSNLSKMIGAIIPETITLSTHNRPIQTIYPMETLARIYRMPNDLKDKYLNMIRPHLVESPSQSSNVRTPVQAWQTDRVWTAYFPCFFAFFEDPSMNLDTRFVENLEIDIKIRKDSDIFWSGDLGDRAAQLGALGTYASIANTAGVADYVDENTSCSGLDTGPFNTVRHRRLARVVAEDITVQALAYYYNFHDTTSQAIRDSNYKPNVPASILTYNTYAENPINIPASILLGGGNITLNLSCNNLTHGITIMVRRKSHLNSKKHVLSAFQDFTQTLPLKDIVLTGSGQQLYSATGAECLMIDQWDNALSTNKSGHAMTNTSGLYADNMASSHITNKAQTDHFFAYHIPFGFSQDMTYNSGAVALQTINNPTITVGFHALDGWVIQDDSLAVKNSSFFNRNTQLGANASLTDLVQDNEFELIVYENFWQMESFIQHFLLYIIQISNYTLCRSELIPTQAPSRNLSICSFVSNSQHFVVCIENKFFHCFISFHFITFGTTCNTIAFNISNVIIDSIDSFTIPIAIITLFLHELLKITKRQFKIQSTLICV